MLKFKFLKLNKKKLYAKLGLLLGITLGITFTAVALAAGGKPDAVTLSSIAGNVDKSVLQMSTILTTFLY